MDTVEQQRRQLLEEIKTLPADVLQEASDFIARLHQKGSTLAPQKPSKQTASSPHIEHQIEQKPSIAETLENIRRICEEEDFTLEIPPRQNRPDQFVMDDVRIK
ncbi:MAG: hypothetical protein AAFP03_14810 [Cyanobacteria bacterium J06598_3]